MLAALTSAVPHWRRQAGHEAIVEAQGAAGGAEPRPKRPRPNKQERVDDRSAKVPKDDASQPHEAFHACDRSLSETPVLPGPVEGPRRGTDEGSVDSAANAAGPASARTGAPEPRPAADEASRTQGSEPDAPPLARQLVMASEPGEEAAPDG